MSLENFGGECVFSSDVDHRLINIFGYTFSKKSHSVLDVKDLSIGYFLKKKQILISKKINFSIPKGELVSIVGVNGIGKSTLLRTLANMQPALNGIIYLNNKNISDYSSFQLANTISIVLTEPPSSKNLSVLELITLGRHPIPIG